MSLIYGEIEGVTFAIIFFYQSSFILQIPHFHGVYRLLQQKKNIVRSGPRSQNKPTMGRAIFYFSIYISFFNSLTLFVIGLYVFFRYF